MGKKIAVYHFTDKSEKRPKIYKGQLNKLEEYALSLGYPYDDIDIFCDKSLLRSERPEFDRFLECSGQYEALVTKDYYHISVNTMKCMSLLQELKAKGIKVYTIENGLFSWNEAPLEKPRKTATYCCRLGPCDEMKEIIPVHNDIFKLFIEKKTNWTLVDQYYDESSQINGQQQVQLHKLIENREKYDLLLVHNLNNLYYRTSKFCKIRNQIHLDIYSLQEGFLEYKEGII